MSRLIKFRARSLDGSWIYTSPHIMFNFVGEFAYLPGKGKGAAVVPLMKGTIVQHTGLKDKIDVEIYEGDIVEQVEKHGDFPGTYRFSVVWDDEEAAFILVNDVGGPVGGLVSEVTDMTVIGNIYENPELLETAS